MGPRSRGPRRDRSCFGSGEPAGLRALMAFTMLIEPDSSTVLSASPWKAHVGTFFMLQARPVLPAPAIGTTAARPHWGGTSRSPVRQPPMPSPVT